MTAATTFHVTGVGVLVILAIIVAVLAIIYFIRRL
jgi:hypothetical protein